VSACILLCLLLSAFAYGQSLAKEAPKLILFHSPS
jgi:hypothetical protein